MSWSYRRYDRDADTGLVLRLPRGSRAVKWTADGRQVIYATGRASRRRAIRRQQARGQGQRTWFSRKRQQDDRVVHSWGKLFLFENLKWFGFQAVALGVAVSLGGTGLTATTAIRFFGPVPLWSLMTATVEKVRLRKAEIREVSETDRLDLLESGRDPGQSKQNMVIEKLGLTNLEQNVKIAELEGQVANLERTVERLRGDSPDRPRRDRDSGRGFVRQGHQPPER